MKVIISVILASIVFYSCEDQKVNDLTFISNDEITTEENVKNLERLQEIKKALDFKIIDEDSLTIILSQSKKYDNTKQILEVFDKGSLTWKFYAYKTNSKNSSDYYNKNIYDYELEYSRVNSTKQDYRNADYNALLKKGDETIGYNDEIKITPYHGKTKYLKYSPKKLVPHKHLGPRYGCVFHIKFKNDTKQIFRNQTQSHLIKKVFYKKNRKGDIFVELINTKNNDSLFLKSCNNDPEELANLIDIVEGTKSNSLNKIKWYNRATKSLGIGTAVLVAVGAATWLGLSLDEILENSDNIPTGGAPNTGGDLPEDLPTPPAPADAFMAPSPSIPDENIFTHTPTTGLSEDIPSAPKSSLRRVFFHAALYQDAEIDPSNVNNLRDELAGLNTRINLLQSKETINLPLSDDQQSELDQLLSEKKSVTNELETALQRKFTVPKLIKNLHSESRTYSLFSNSSGTPSHSPGAIHVINRTDIQEVNILGTENKQIEITYSNNTKSVFSRGVVVINPFDKEVSAEDFKYVIVNTNGLTGRIVGDAPVTTPQNGFTMQVGKKALILNTRDSGVAGVTRPAHERLDIRLGDIILGPNVDKQSISITPTSALEILRDVP